MNTKRKETPKTAERLLGNNYKWSVIGAGKDQFKSCTMGALLGGNCRVGLEDNLFLSKGRLAKSDAEQVVKNERHCGNPGV